MKQLLQSSQQNEQMSTHNGNRNNDKTMKCKSLYANTPSEIKIDKGWTTITQIDDRYLLLTKIWSSIMAQEATFERSTSLWRGLVPVSLQWHGHFVPRFNFNCPPPGLTTIKLPPPPGKASIVKCPAQGPKNRVKCPPYAHTHPLPDFTLIRALFPWQP